MKKTIQLSTDEVISLLREFLLQAVAASPGAEIYISDWRFGRCPDDFREISFSVVELEEANVDETTKKPRKCEAQQCSS